VQSAEWEEKKGKNMSLDMEILFAVAAAVFGTMMALVVRGKSFVVPEGFVGLLYRHGKSWHRLSPGKHRFWKFGYSVRLVDVRKTVVTVAGQEVLSADNVGLKVSAALTYKIEQPEKAVHEVQDFSAHLYNAVQLAMRSVIGGLPIESLLTQRLEIGKQLQALVHPELERIGIFVFAVEVKDVMFPGELKKVFAEVLKAQKEGQAALERARGETAALRNLANAARMLENNPALMNLRLLQSIASASASGAGNTLALGMPAGFVGVNGKNGKDEG
jgi:regulator of protease activity HflC (stomatin/prohibitin superfamily)